MMITKKTICFFLVSFLLLSALAACRNDGVPASESGNTEKNAVSAAGNEESKAVPAAESDESPDVASVDVSAEETGRIRWSSAEGTGKRYVWEKEIEGGEFSITLKDDGTYTFCEGMLSSYLGFGTWTEEDGVITLNEDEERFALTADALIYIAEGSKGFIYAKVGDGDKFYLSGRIGGDSARYAPDYKSKNTLRADQFLAKLKADGYHEGDTVETSFNTDNIEGVFNITPAAIAEENASLDIFCVQPGEFCFFMYKGEIYRYETFGGYHNFLLLWDYDGNGIKDLVSFHSYGSGVSYLAVSVTDLTTLKSAEVIRRGVLWEKVFTFAFDDENIYLDGEKLTYSDGKFHCGSLLE